MSTAPTGTTGSYPGSPFVGREAEQVQLCAGIQSAADGRGRLTLLSGEPGIGKTRLAEWLTTEAGKMGIDVLWGRCYEGEGAPAYWPWSQILRGILSLHDPDSLRAELGADAAHLAQIVPEIERTLPDLDPLPAMNPEQARFRLFDAVTRLLKRRGNEQPQTVILEDLHWADAPSLLLLQFLTGELRGSRLLVLGTYRNLEVQRQHPLSATLANLAREPVAQRITLHRFTSEEVASLIEQVSGTTPTGEMVEATWRETEGNPFFVTEVVRLFDIGEWSMVPEDRSLAIRIPESIREVVGQRLDRLSPECNELLAVAAVVGREFDLSTLEAVTGQSAVELLPLLDEASQAQIIESGESFGRYRFSHRLIQETLYDELPSSRRYQLHSEIGAAIEERHAADLRENYGTLAYHYAQAPLGPNIEKAIDYATRAAERSMRQVAWEQAVSSYELALQMLDLQPDASAQRRCELLLALGSAQHAAGSGRGQTPGSAVASSARSTYWDAVEAARTIDSPEYLAEAVLGLSWRANAPLMDQRIVTLLEEVLGQLPSDDSVDRALVQTLLAAAYRNFKQFSGVTFAEGTEARIEALSAESIAMADRVDDPSTMAMSRALGWFSIWHPSRMDTLERLIREARTIAATEKPDDQSITLHEAYCNAVCRGDVVDAKRVIGEMVALYEETRTPRIQWLSGVLQAAISLSEGRFARTTALIDEADSIWPNTGIIFNQRFALYRELDRLQEAETSLHAILRDFPQSPWFRLIRILYLLETGDKAQALLHFKTIDVDVLADLARGEIWARALALCAELCVALEQEEDARRCYELLKPYPHHVVYWGYVGHCAGSVSHYLGLLAGFLEEYEMAERHFARAFDQHQSMGFHPLVAHTRLEWARMLFKRGEAGDLERASDLLDETLDTARRLGMIRLERLAGELLAEVRPATGAAPAGLSPREAEVLELVVAGLSNPEIGERLYISPRTVSQHLRSVFNKLNVSNRAAAVARWIELSRD